MSRSKVSRLTKRTSHAPSGMPARTGAMARIDSQKRSAVMTPKPTSSGT